MCDLLIAAMPRSGSTLLANLLTDPEEKRWCIIEPGALSISRIKPLAAQMGFSIEGDDIPAINAFLNVTLRKWGIKEVISGRYQHVHVSQEPNHIVLCIRDLRDVAISLREFHRQQDKGAKAVTKSVGNYAHNILRFFGRFSDSTIEPYIFRYETLVEDPDSALKDLERAINWPATGDPNRWLEYFRRADEVRKGVKSRRTEKDREKHADLVKAVNDLHHPYQNVFGYVS